MVSRQLPASGPAAQCLLPAGPGGTAAPELSSAYAAPPPPAVAAPSAQTSSPPSEANDNMGEPQKVELVQVRGGWTVLEILP